MQRTQRNIDLGRSYRKLPGSKVANRILSVEDMKAVVKKKEESHPGQAAALSQVVCERLAGKAGVRDARHDIAPATVTQ